MFSGSSLIISPALFQTERLPDKARSNPKKRRAISPIKTGLSLISPLTTDMTTMDQPKMEK
jgi:hypothetical protein